MDLITLDVTDLKNVKIGDDVEFVGDTITLDDVATAANTAPYEILTSLSHRAPRHYVEGER
jgi:alanine racemase